MTSESDHRHKCDAMSVPLSHLSVDCFSGVSACLVGPSFYFDEARTRIFLAREVKLYLESTSGRANFAPLVLEALEHYGRNSPRVLGQLVARVPRVLAWYSQVLTVLMDEIDLGKRSLQEAIRRSQFSRPVSEHLRKSASRLELLRVADDISKNGHVVFLDEERRDDIPHPREPTSDQKRLLQVTGNEQAAKALSKATQGKRQPSLFRMVVAVLPCDLHRAAIKPVSVSGEGPWLSVFPWDRQERLGTLTDCYVSYVVDPDLKLPDGAVPLAGKVICHSSTL